MKRYFLLALALAAALWLVAGPWAVGVYLRVWAPAWIAEWTTPGAHQFESGWFRSRLAAQWPDGSRLELAGRHLPPGRPGWLSVTGDLRPPEAEPIRIDGHFSLLGALELTAASPRVRLNEAVEVEAERPEVKFFQRAGGAFQFDGRLARLVLNDDHANRLRMERSAVRLSWNPRSGDLARMELNLETRRTGLGSSRLKLALARVDRQTLFELLAGLEQFQRAMPDSFEQRMAALAMAGAWQELVAAGLEVTLESLELDGQARFSGHWHPASGPPEIYGEGRTETLLAWLQPVIGLVRGVDPEQARREARAWLEALADQHWLKTDHESFRFDYGGTGPDEIRMP